MVGPCLCGDPACGSCGDPAWEEIEAAQEEALEWMSRARLTAVEYRIVVRVGLVAVKQARRAIVAAMQAKELRGGG